VLSLTFQQEDFTIGLTDENTALLMPGVNVQRVWGRERLIATRGARLQLDLKGAQEGLLSDASFVQGQVDAKLILPLGERQRLISRGTLGAIYTDDFERLPPSIRYFAGGDQSVRGYDYNRLGPRDASGEVIGGRYLVVGSLELERHIRGNWRAALFYDTGNALDGWNESLEQGAGIGLRWETPIGLVRLDVATALSEDGRPWRLHLTVGPDL
jgi:translocation and assembly module TamA